MVEVSVDDFTGVLYAKETEATPVICDHAPSDMSIIFSFDSAQRIVGATILGAAEADPADWAAHPDRDFLPPSILQAIDNWFHKARQ
jgi:hypothetical protein